MKTTTATLALLVLAACAAPPRLQPALRGDAPLALQGAALPAAAWPASRWWQRYDDPVLAGLVERALAGAPRIAAASARLATAREQVRLAGAAQGAQVQLNAQFDRLRLSENGLLPTEFLGFSWYNQADLGLAVSYQLDWWGRQRASLDAALDRARAATAEQRAAEVALSAAVATEYFGWQADAARIDLARDRLTVIAEQRSLSTRRIGARLESADGLQLLEQQQAAAEESLALLETSQRLRRVALAALLAADEATLPALAPRALPPVATGLPEQTGINLLSHRADVTASRWRVEAATRETDVVRASYYPDISLRALAGLSSIELGKLLQAGSATPRIGAALNLPLFDSGLRDARHGAARAALDESIAAYNETVVAAARELGMAAQRVSATTTQHLLRERSRQAADALLASARARVSGGLTHRGPELAARSQVLDAQESLVQIQYERVAADIQLTLALGGGYTEQEPVPK
ncbi:MAG: efflux transporter outer membrane subunit [Proteobacteria bacterium]|nr:efflux transporter outer membrane subunit [Pseudomonadota bacterium]